MTLSIDLETYSGEDLKTAGVYKYAEHPDFEILLFAFAFGDDPVQVVDLASGEELPGRVLRALQDPQVTKQAFNAQFERVCLSRHFGFVLPPEQWACTMVLAMMCGLPASLDQVTQVLKLPGKQADGKALIKKFCVPQKPTKANGMKTRLHPADDLAGWHAFKVYNADDVTAERGVYKHLAHYRTPSQERDLWFLDQRINDRGVLLDLVLVEQCVNLDTVTKRDQMAEAVELTGLDNPNSPKQILTWLKEADPLAAVGDTLTKKDVRELLENEVTNGEAIRMLELRREMAKTSVKKYVAMLRYACADGRARGLLQYCGASRTWRWAGRGIQVHNLPRISLKSKDLDLARRLVRAGDRDLVQLIFGNVPDTLSQLIRTAFIARPGHRFLVADFAAIEARVLAWLAGEKWRLAVFQDHGKIYEASAAQMFKIPIDTIDKESPYRQRGKVSELALGYQGGPDALISMGALEMGIPEEELPKLVKMWRNANKAIARFWQLIQDAAIEAVSSGTPQKMACGVLFYVERNTLYMRLPSGRCLAYYQPVIREGRFGPALYYWGMNQTTKKWQLDQTYGGKLTENLVQAVARDLLAHAMLAAENAGYPLVFHVHDEIVAEVRDGVGSTEDLDALMARGPAWSRGLPLKAESYETMYYKK